MGQRGTGYHKATVVHMESLEAKLAVKAAYEFARRALANDGRIDCAEADHLMTLLETAFEEVREARVEPIRAGLNVVPLHDDDRPRAA